MWDLTIHPPWEPNVLAGTPPVSGFATIYTSPNPPLANIIHFGSLRIAVSLTIFKTRLLERGFHTLIRNVSFLSPTEGGPTKRKSQQRTEESFLLLTIYYKE